MKQNKVLIVDDEEAILLLFEKALSRAGFQVRTAMSGEQALEVLENEKISVIFSDLNMEQMDGIELCKKIKKERPMTIMFAMTGYASLFELADCRDAGFDDYFKKPFKIPILIKAAENAFEKMNRWKTK